VGRRSAFSAALLKNKGQEERSESLKSFERGWQKLNSIGAWRATALLALCRFGGKVFIAGRTG